MSYIENVLHRYSRFLFAVPATVLLLLIPEPRIESFSERVGLAFILIFGILIGCRGATIAGIFAGRGFAPPVFLDRWSHGYIFGSVGYWCFVFVFVEFRDTHVYAPLFLLGMTLLYATGKMGCWRFG